MVRHKDNLHKDVVCVIILPARGGGGAWRYGIKYKITPINIGLIPMLGTRGGVTMPLPRPGRLAVEWNNDNNYRRIFPDGESNVDVCDLVVKCRGLQVSREMN
jgi:hypothetical protein